MTGSPTVAIVAIVFYLLVKKPPELAETKLSCFHVGISAFNTWLHNCGGWAELQGLPRYGSGLFCLSALSCGLQIWAAPSSLLPAPHPHKAQNRSSNFGPIYFDVIRVRRKFDVSMFGP